MPSRKKNIPLGEETAENDFLAPKPKRRRVAPRKKIAIEKEVAEEKSPRFVVREAEENLTPTPKFYRRIALTFLVAAVILILAVLYFTVGSAEIKLTLKNKDVKVDTTALITEKPMEKGQIFGKVAQTVVKGDKTFSVSGGGTPVVGISEGKVIVYNKRTMAQTLIATTRLLSPSGILFRLKKTISIPANGETEADVYADKTGADSEIEATHFTIPGLSDELQKLVYAESKDKMIGGLRYSKILASDDIDKAVAVLTQKLFEKGQTQLKAVSSTMSFTASLFSFTTDNTKTDAKIGETADQFKVSLGLKVTGVFYNLTDVNKYLSEQMRASLADYEILSGVPNKPNIEINRVDAVKGMAELHLFQTAGAQVSYLEDVIDKSKILGKDKSEAEDYLKSLPWIDSVAIKTMPSWMKTIPAEMSKVKIKVNQ